MAYTLSGGLTLTLGAGNLIQGESFTRNLRKLLFGGSSRSHGLVERLRIIVGSAERDLAVELGSGAYENPFRG